ncbi:MAG: formylglycine-generating enzyme family protein [Planctomycetota bacterium]|jgi:formylglycine-generating enzyme required for sulfatase activity|nr:formylglycine-generating enzyme family protein [Planctomycetota bacterium]
MCQPFLLATLFAICLQAEDAPKKVTQRPDLPPAPEGMVIVAAGEFTMGSSDEQVEKAGAQYGGAFVYEGEKPQREVQVEDFFVDIHPVTNKQFKAFLDATGYRPQGNRYQKMWFLRHWADGTYPPGKADHPVTYITWHNAQAYAKWKGKRLPTEAEFEKAARGTDGRLWPWGDEFDYGKSNVRIWGKEKFADTTPVNSYPAGKSPYGCLDMAGNVFEWTSDLDPEQLKKGNKVAVLKGGSWKSFDSYARCAFRQHAEAAGFGPHIGFRCAISPADVVAAPKSEK